MDTQTTTQRSQWDNLPEPSEVRKTLLSLGKMIDEIDDRHLDELRERLIADGLIKADK